MTVYLADFDAIESHVAHAQRFSDRVEQAAVHLQRVVDDLHLTWAGQAAAAHRVAHQEWSRGAEAMREALAAMAAAARHARSGYASAATANRDMWGPVE